MIMTACVVAVLLALSVSAGAQDFNSSERTFLTFSKSVEMPGMTLPAGTYTFRLADSPARNVVQVLSQNEKTIHGQFLFVQSQRMDVTGKTVVTFYETREGTTPAIQYWFYPGEKIGKEFIYPREQAERIAARTGQGVRSVAGLIRANTTATATDGQGQVTELERDDVTAANESQVPGDAIPSDASAGGNDRDSQAPGLATERADTPFEIAADNSSDTPVAVGTSGIAEDQRQARNELPRTASPMALSGLLGLLSLLGAAGLRTFRG
jgi:hypothetical protein